MQCYLRTLPEDCTENYFFRIFLKVFYTHSRNNWNFSRTFTFQIIGLFLLSMPGFYTMEARQIDQPSNRTKQRIILTKYSCSF